MRIKCITKYFYLTFLSILTCSFICSTLSFAQLDSSANLPSVTQDSFQVSSLNIGTGYSLFSPSISTGYPSVTPSIGTGYSSLGTGIGAGLPSLIPGIGTGYPSFTPTFTPGIGTGYPSLGMGIGAGLPSLIPGIGTGYPSFTPAFTPGIGTGYPSLGTGIWAGLPSLIPGIGTGYPSFTPAFTPGIGTGYPSLGTGIGAGLPSLIPGIGTGYPTFTPGIGTGYPSLGTGIGAGLPSLTLGTGINYPSFMPIGGAYNPPAVMPSDNEAEEQIDQAQAMMIEYTIYSSLRILHLNAQSKSPIFDIKPTNSDEDELAPNQNGNDIIHDKDKKDYDVVALSEVWDEDAKNAYVNILSEKYPYYVKMISGSKLMGLGEDSGLMLFSRYPFECLPYKNWRYVDMPNDFGWFTVSGNTDSQRVAFVQFSDSDGMDSMAGKGALMVRIRNKDGVFYNLILTHLQADGEYMHIRIKQLKEIQDMIIAVLGDHFDRINRENTLLMGDLNINGNLCDDGEDLAEYWWHYGETSLHDAFFFNGPFYDTWIWSTSLDDCGVTCGTNRYDYILHNAGLDFLQSNKKDFAVDPQPNPYFRAQHLTRPIYWSDHRGVAIDINAAAPYSNPRVARVLRDDDLKPTDGPNGTKNDPIFDGEIKWCGSMQWYRIEASGTYTFILPKQYFGDDKIKIKLYAKEDLTTIIGEYNNEVKEVCGGPPEYGIHGFGGCYEERTYHMPEAPFYMQVFHSDRNVFGTSYAFAVHKHNCLSREDACIIGPNEQPMKPLADDYMDTVDQATLQGNGAVWLRGNLDSATCKSSFDQNVNFYLNNDTQEPMQLTLFFLDPSTSDGLSMEGRGYDYYPYESDAPYLSIPKTIDERRPFYLMIDRSSNAQVNFTTGWTTNLKYFVGKYAVPGADHIKLYIKDETSADWLGSDELYLFFYMDVYDHRYAKIYIGDADTDDTFPLDQNLYSSRYWNQDYGNLSVVSFIHDVQLNITEDDGIIVDSYGGTILPGLPAGTLPLDVPTLLNASKRISVGSGKYDIKYTITSLQPNAKIE